MAVQAHAPNSGGLPPEGPALSEPPPTAFLPAHPQTPPLGGAVVELVGRPTATPRFVAQPSIESAVESAVLPHQLHEIDQVIEIARLSELLVEKDARISLLERGVAEWRERARVEIEAHSGAERLAFERERDLVGVIHQQISAIDSAEATTREAFVQADELRARLDEQMTLVEDAEHNTQAALARLHELQSRIDELEERLRQRARHWWRRRAA